MVSVRNTWIYWCFTTGTKSVQQRLHLHIVPSSISINMKHFELRRISWRNTDDQRRAKRIFLWQRKRYRSWWRYGCCFDPSSSCLTLHPGMDTVWKTKHKRTDKQTRTHIGWIFALYVTLGSRNIFKFSNTRYHNRHDENSIILFIPYLQYR